MRRDDPRALIKQAVPMHIDQALINWGRWAGSGRSGSASLSIESRYRRRGEDSDSGGTVPVDEHAACRMERIMRWLPDKERALLVGHYVYRAPWQVLCRALALRLRKDGYDDRLKLAATMAWNRYEVLPRQS